MGSHSGAVPILAGFEFGIDFEGAWHTDIMHRRSLIFCKRFILLSVGVDPPEDLFSNAAHPDQKPFQHL